MSNNPFDIDAAATGARKYLTEEEYQEFKRLSAKIMAGVGKSGLGGRATSEKKKASSALNGKKGGRPRKPDDQLKRPRREKKAAPATSEEEQNGKAK